MQAVCVSERNCAHLPFVRPPKPPDPRNAVSRSPWERKQRVEYVAGVIVRSRAAIATLPYACRRHYALVAAPATARKGNLRSTRAHSCALAKLSASRNDRSVMASNALVCRERLVLSELNRVWNSTHDL